MQSKILVVIFNENEKQIAAVQGNINTQFFPCLVNASVNFL